jgi:hypothetical protein
MTSTNIIKIGREESRPVNFNILWGI